MAVPFTKNKTVMILAGLAMIALCLFLFLGKKSTPTNQKTQPSEIKATLAVETVQPSVANWPMTITVNGAITAWQEAQVSAEISGLRIRQVLTDVGSQVKRGQDLVLLADEAVRADLQKQEATVASAQASLAEAKSNADRAREIKDSGAMSSQQINQYLIAEQTAQANLALAQAELENQKIRLRQTHVVAADDGVISSRSANLGNVVNAGAELFRLIRQGRIEWRAEVNAQQLTQIKKGQKVRITLPDQQRVEGVVRLAAPTLDVNTRNAIVYVDIANTHAKPGMYAQGSIDVGQQQAIVVPQSAVVLRDGRAYLFTVNAIETARSDKMYQVKKLSVTTGRREGDWVEITTGLSGHPALVKTGGAFLNDGDWVNVIALPAGAK
ncbi:MAG: efflux RND transporter periplasmic adaptor subunit [Methylophilus sp.]|nr:efflux RND transporter periplasmic adaptor subunit [Methylophilus sp.]